MVWYLYTVVKYTRRMHFSFVEFATNSYENKRLFLLNASSWAPKIIRSFTVLLFNIIILFTEASM